MIQKTPCFLGLNLNIDMTSCTVNTVPAEESVDASRPVRVCAVDASSSVDDVPPLRGPLCQGAGEALKSGSPSARNGRTCCEHMRLEELLSQIDIDQNVAEAHNQMNLLD
jgi:hypothetical protein